MGNGETAAEQRDSVEEQAGVQAFCSGGALPILSTMVAGGGESSSVGPVQCIACPAVTTQFWTHLGRENCIGRAIGNAICNWDEHCG